MEAYTFEARGLKGEAVRGIKVSPDPDWQWAVVLGQQPNLCYKVICSVAHQPKISRCQRIMAATPFPHWVAKGYEWRDTEYVGLRRTYHEDDGRMHVLVRITQLRAHYATPGWGWLRGEQKDLVLVSGMNDGGQSWYDGLVEMAPGDVIRVVNGMVGNHSVLTYDLSPGLVVTTFKRSGYHERQLNHLGLRIA